MRVLSAAVGVALAGASMAPAFACQPPPPIGQDGYCMPFDTLQSLGADTTIISHMRKCITGDTLVDKDTVTRAGFLQQLRDEYAASANAFVVKVEAVRPRPSGKDTMVLAISRVLKPGASPTPQKVSVLLDAAGAGSCRKDNASVLGHSYLSFSGSDYQALAADVDPNGSGGLYEVVSINGSDYVRSARYPLIDLLLTKLIVDITTTQKHVVDRTAGTRRLAARRALAGSGGWLLDGRRLPAPGLAWGAGSSARTRRLLTLTQQPTPAAGFGRMPRACAIPLEAAGLVTVKP